VLIICIGPFPYYMDNETHEPEDWQLLQV
jgi:hypothetical protein